MITGVKTPSRDGWLSRAGFMVATCDPAPHLLGFIQYRETQTDNREAVQAAVAIQVSYSEQAAQNCRADSSQ